MTEFESVFLFRCPMCGGSVVLPRQSALGEYGGQQYHRRTDRWPLIFLCRERGKLCECSTDSIQTNPVQKPIPPPHLASLWEIECECAHNDCGLAYTIYAKYQQDETPGNMTNTLLQSKPILACDGGHPVKFQAEKIEVKRLEF
jgi:hypothetical protein